METHKRLFLGFFLLILGILMGVFTMTKTTNSYSQIDTLRVRFPIGRQMPDPANIVWTGEWYLLDHLSSGLIQYDSNRGLFRSMLADRWEISDNNIHRFYIKKDIIFSDGTPITAKDFAATLKRLLIRKSSSHFPLWDYVEGCENLKSLNDDCSGLKIVDDHTLDIKLKGRYRSFLLQLASPETGVWSAADIADDAQLTIHPKRFSGPYTLESFDPNTKFVLKRNPLNQTSKEFQQSPERIEIPLNDLSVCEEMMAKGELDVFLKDPLPTGERDWKKLGVETLKSSPSTLIYFSGVSRSEQKNKVAFNVISDIWTHSPFDGLLPATSLLPFEKAYKLDVESIKDRLPKDTAKTIRLGIPHTYFQKDFLDYLVSIFKKHGSDLQLITLSREEYPKMFDNPSAIERIDYILAPYAASERYPAVQLRFMTGKLKKSPIDLKEAETPELDDRQIQTLKGYQEWLLTAGHIVPLFFEKTLVLHQANIDLGVQEASDSEIELWRARKVNK
jgi:hypothetical protein